MKDAETKLREEARGLLLSAQRLVEHGETVAPAVILILPDCSKLETLPLVSNEADKQWAFSKLCQMARQVQAVAAILLYYGRSSTDYEPGTLAPPDERQKEGGTPCVVVAVKVPGQQSEWSGIAWYRMEGTRIFWLPVEEHDSCVAPLLPDWYGEVGRA